MPANGQESVATLREVILGALQRGDRSLFWSAIEDLDLLPGSSFPEDRFQLLLEILRTPGFREMEDVFEFMFMLTYNWDTFSDSQKERLLNVLDDTSWELKDELSQSHIQDLFSRASYHRKLRSDRE